MHRKVIALAAAVIGIVTCGPAWAGWPDDKPIEVVIGFAPGGGTDVMARKLLPFVEQRLGGKAKFVVLNKPGAGGEIAFASIARAAPDAYAMGVVNVPGYNFIPMTRKTQYSMDEIRLVARVVDDPSVIVVPAASKLASLADVLAALRSKPGSITFGHNGAGTNGHLAIRMLAKAAKVEPNEISYRGTAAQRTDLLGGHLDVGMVSLSEVPELHGTNKGQLRAIAILSKQRSPSLPDVPTAEEAGIPVTMTAERGFAVPKAVSDEVVNKLEAAIADGLRDPEYIKSSPGDAPVLAFMPGAEWQKRLDDMTQALRPFAEEMRASEQK
ncbi:tripartite tricarboxylate transporter substrate binding protein [Bradyrhizobium sp. sBnM-33]|uniref:tripartite tricarboxylate transporter substrate binding protein n=1 Tax=Bradyrhizobium sp. sBnM-33 TaxID=2831780 RepID=UPI001BCB4D7D|nr:tripartite tricarboxylate transporter substrate binding protein [Bradyrhizobium sp. sBnM-33]WOH50247.1 tripartite tricarboxylate transporter substrate binding protein [Bradyrhizobium sp. sBnM-33]